MITFSAASCPSWTFRSSTYDELKGKYCPDNGRTAYDPVMMFKYLVLKAISGLSNEKLVERCRCDLSYKFFLGLMPEDGVIEASTLSRFRRQRIADGNLLDLLLGKTAEAAKERGVIDGRTIIMDSTHTLSRCSPANQVEALQKAAKSMRRMVYGVDEGRQIGEIPRQDGAAAEADRVHGDLRVQGLVQAPVQDRGEELGAEAQLRIRQGNLLRGSWDGGPGRGGNLRVQPVPHRAADGRKKGETGGLTPNFH